MADAQALKMTVTNNAVAAVEEALSLTGNHGLSRTNPLERHLRDVLCGRVQTPQDDTIKLDGRASCARHSVTSSKTENNNVRGIHRLHRQQSVVGDHAAVRARCSNVTYIETLAKAHENAGFDRALLAFHATLPDCLQVGQHVAYVTERLNVFIAQRPGFTAPTLFARQFATLDHLTKGRISLNVITGGDSTELAQDGNTIDDKDERYARTKEFLDVVRAEWTSEKPFDYDGKYYQVKRGFSQIKPYQKNGIPVFIAGASDAAIEVAGHHADVFALWGETYEEVRNVIAKVKAACAKTGRAVPRFSLSFRPILADTEEKAWAKAHATAGAGEGRAGQDRIHEEAGRTCERRLEAAAGAGGERRAPGQAPVDRHGRAHRRARQLDLAGRHAAAGRGIAGRILRPRHRHLPDPRFRSADRLHRVRPRADPADEEADRRAR